MAYRVRGVRNLDEYRVALGSIGHYFGWIPSEEDAERFSRQLPLERMHGVWEGSEIVAGTGAVPFELTVPGGPVPCAGVTVVGVRPTHRRRGLMRRLMLAQLKDIRERGEPIAALWASEETIYGRYGYGLASLAQIEMRLPRAYARLQDDGDSVGSMRLVDHDEALRTFPRVYDRVRRRRVGFLSRSRDWWDLRTLDDHAERRRGAGPMNRALLELDGRPAGYALYRVKSQFEGAVNTGHVSVIEALGVSPEATREVWRFVLGIDWLGEVRTDLLALDHELLHLVTHPTRMRWQIADGIWIRPIDVPTALAARSYAGDGRVTLEITADLQFPDNIGTYTIDGGEVRRSRRRPDVRLGVQALGSVFLGGFTFAALAAGGRVEEGVRGGVARADALFGTDRLPWTPEIF